MHKLYLLIKWEFLVQNRINNLIKYLFIFFLFYIFSVTFISNQEDIRKTGIICSVIFLPISLIGFSHLVFKQDLEDGGLELLLSSYSALEIVLAKFFSIFFGVLVSSAINFPIMYIIFDFSSQLFICLFFSLILLLILASSLLILVASIQSYFKSNTNFLSTLIMPLLIPNIIITGLVLQDVANIKLMFIMVGVNMMILPICFILSSYLIKNIYNI